MRFFDRADVCAGCDFNHVGKSQLLHGCQELRDSHVLAELSDERRRDDGYDLIVLEYGADDLIDLTLVHDCAERTADQTLAAGDAAVIVDARLAVFIDTDSVHAACGLTGALKIGDGVIWAGFGAFAALDAQFLVNEALAVDEFDGALRAHALT